MRSYAGWRAERKALWAVGKKGIRQNLVKNEKVYSWG